MCGIAGWIDWERDLTKQGDVLEAMGATLACRGPDERGTWLAPRVGLAHRRLVVVDPAGGRQPMVRRRGEDVLVIVYNGELYNTPDLRRDLEARGHHFLGHSDTEALLAAYIEWGPDCLERLNGIFAFGVWSAAAQSLFLARDRLGVKPLFYTEREGGLLFGSEIKALLAHPAVPPVVDADGLAEVLVMGPGRTPGHGVFRGIKEVRPGHWLLYDRRGLQAHRYWSLQSRPHEHDLEKTTAHVRELLGDTVERQLVADVPVCTLLSGGLDSSALTAFATRAFSRDGRGALRTFSVDYTSHKQHFTPSEFEPGADAPWVARVSTYLGTVHRRVVLDNPTLEQALHDVVRARDLPGMADIDSSLYLFCRRVKDESTVAISGEAADEVFGGYPWFRREADLQAHTFPWVRSAEERVRLLSPEVVARINPEAYLAQRYHEALAEVPRLPGEDAREARLREITYLSLTRFMATLLDRKDRMSMAAGLEVRVPFCDHRLMEYVWNIPWAIKNCDGREKGLLRRALAGLLPDDVLQRRKSPYPKTHDPSYLTAVRNRLLSILDDRGSPLHPLIDIAAVRAVAQAAERINLPWYGQLMAGPQLLSYLLQVDFWLREYRVIIS